jgi:hypothetical protein
MVSLNVPNVITIGLIAIVVVAAAKWGLTAFGMSASWL